MNLIPLFNRNLAPLRAALFSVALAIPAWYCLRFYWRYIGQAWFFQDDFFFILDYESQLKAWQLMSTDNFGRFVSRNLYWWGMLKTFGRDASAFFQVNLLMMLSTAGLLFCFVRPVSAWLAAFAAVAYMVSGGTVGNFSWLSNSQHLLAHLFIAAYLVVVSLAWRRDSVVGILASVPVFVLALGSNLLSAVALSWPMLLLLTQRPKNKALALALVGSLVVNGLLVLALVWVLRGTQSGAYATSLAFPVLARNMGHYFGSATTFGLLTAVVFIGGFSALRKGRPTEAWLMFAGPLFILPFLPLVNQHYINYAAFSHAFVLTGVACLVMMSTGAWRWAACILLVGLSFFFLRESHRNIKYFDKVQRGANERVLIHAMDQAVKSGRLPPGATVCFSQAGEQHPVDSPLPPYWWGLAFGKAFKVFVDHDAGYELLEAGRQCTHQATVNQDELRIRQD